MENPDYIQRFEARYLRQFALIDFRDRQMTMTTPKEWYQCMEAGAAAVRRPYALPQFRQKGIERITIYHLPSFSSCTGWTVFELQDGSGYILHSVTWNQLGDMQRFEDFIRGATTSISSEPTLESRTRALDATWFEHQMAALASIRIPLCTAHPIGLDGETCGVHLQNEFDVEWWSIGPSEWADLTKWTHGCIEYFQKPPRLDPHIG